ncbi:alpha/beta hydrolase fold domain-containing protein [Dickeya chrysanthemi]|uniref:Alpha/beta hydrolase fold domain-containing protein n=1 Tax=Dickeya chrysanthemi TaxID=556 RepID=A0ABU8JP45_DICCH
MSLSQEFKSFIAQLRAGPVPLDQLTDIEELRTTFNALGRDLPSLPDVVFRQVDAADVPAEWVEPTGSDPSRVIFYLHGGGLALSTLVSLREGCKPLPAATVLLSPWTDLTLQSESHFTKVKDDPIITRKFLELSRQHYIGTRIGTYIHSRVR